MVRTVPLLMARKLATSAAQKSRMVDRQQARLV
jgi:energy-coupling factor transporter transmembrane protein EcfT